MTLIKPKQSFRQYILEQIPRQPCPFCGGKKLIVEGPDFDVEGYFVHCIKKSCRADGPFQKSKKRAVKLWNSWGK